MQHTFYSNGKLLITGEYLILDGAKGLALPTKTGQNLIVKETNSGAIHWRSYDSDGSLWFEDHITFQEIKEPNNTSAESVKAKFYKLPIV
jgi:mevalonate kinase